jgi:hypothetical protein
MSAILLQSQKAEIFQVGKRNIQNQKMIDNWGNAKIALPLSSNKKRKSSDQVRFFILDDLAGVLVTKTGLISFL